MSQPAKVLEQRALQRDIFLLRLSAPHIAATARPGQFFMLRVSQAQEPILPRPFSIHGVEGDDLLALYRVVGRGTALLSQARAGQELLAWGPLGRGFDLAARRPLLVAGGLGCAPITWAGLALARHGAKPEMLLGLAGAAGFSGMVDWLSERAASAGLGWGLCSEDGSLGEKGLVSAPLAARLGSGADACDGVLACGPMGMLKAVARICAQHGVPCQVSLEAPMACGLGACLGCAIPAVGGGYVRACQEGPVFRAEDVDWERL